jgi:hypothetical protein
MEIQTRIISRPSYKPGGDLLGVGILVDHVFPALELLAVHARHAQQVLQVEKEEKEMEKKNGMEKEKKMEKEMEKMEKENEASHMHVIVRQSAAQGVGSL